MDNLKQKAVAHREALAAYETAFREYFDNQVAELPAERFWALQSVLCHEVLRFHFGYGRSNGIEQAAEEFFRKPAARDYRDSLEYTLEEAIQFAKTWREWRQRLYGPLFDVVQNRGDDAYGDLLDALPLAGREVVEEAMAGEFANEPQLEAAVLVGCDGNQRLVKLILHGENYIGMFLAEAACQRFALRQELENAS